MHHDPRRITILPALAAACLLAAASPPASAADVSPWDEGMHSAARLIAASAQNPVLRAGIEIRLDRGWKTYWRYPGDSGLPPRFDFSGSENVRSVTVLWPAPVRFDDGAGGHAIGYTGSPVILPLRIEPEDAATPVRLRMAMDYGVCEKLCIPAQAKAELAITGRPGSQEKRLAAAEALVPVVGRVGDAKPLAMPLAILAVRRATSGGKPTVTVDVAAPQGMAVDLFAEGPAPDWALPLPAPVKAAPAGVHRFAFELDGLPPDARAEGATLRLTAVAGARAVEAAFRLD